MRELCLTTLVLPWVWAVPVIAVIAAWFWLKNKFKGQESKRVPENRTEDTLERDKKAKEYVNFLTYNGNEQE